MRGAEGSTSRRRQPIPVVLAVAGSDSGAGAGIQADLKTCAALGAYAATAVTAVTAQNTRAVAAVHAVPPDIVTAQIDAVFADLPVAAVKVGLLPSVAAVRAVADALRRWAPRLVVVDPVMGASVGAPLQAEDVTAALRAHLLPLATVLTPNVSEASRLAGVAIRSEAELAAAAQALRGAGARWVLGKGGHLAGALATDVLAGPDGCEAIAAPRIATPAGHGTGCTLASAIAVELARGRTVPDAVRRAKAYLGRALAGAERLRIGGGAGPLDHFFFETAGRETGPARAAAPARTRRPRAGGRG